MVVFCALGGKVVEQSGGLFAGMRVYFLVKDFAVARTCVSERLVVGAVLLNTLLLRVKMVDGPEDGENVKKYVLCG